MFNCHEGTVGKIDYEKIKDNPGVDDIYCEIKEGKVVIEDGTTQQKAISVRLKGKDLDEIASLINFVQSNVTVEDLDGNNMLFKPFDTNRLFVK